MSGRRQYNEDSVTVKLSAGGSVSLSFRGTLFELTEDEEALISGLRKLLQRYRNSGSLNGTGAARGDAT